MTKAFVAELFVLGALIGICTMGAYHIGLSSSPVQPVANATAMTMAFATLTLARLFHGFNCRGSKSIFRLGIRSNWWSLGAFALGVLLLSLVLFVPILQPIFTVQPLSLQNVGFVGLFAVIPTVIIQIYKVIRDMIKK